MKTRTDAEQNLVEYERDFLGRVTDVKEHAAAGVVLVTHYVYDGDSQVTSVTNPKGKTWTFEYDGLGRRKKLTNPPSPGFPGGTTHEWTYTLFGDPDVETDENGRKTTYTFDTHHRLTREEHKNSLNQVEEVILRTYDGADRLKSVETTIQHPCRVEYE